VAEQLRGESRIPELLLDGGPERVPELVRMPALKAETAGHLIRRPAQGLPRYFAEHAPGGLRTLVSLATFKGPPRFH